MYIEMQLLDSTYCYLVLYACPVSYLGCDVTDKGQNQSDRGRTA